MPPAPSVQIKGSKEGLIVTLGAGLWELLLRELENRLNATPQFFRGGRVILSTGWRALSEKDLQTIGELLDRYGISLWAVVSDVEQTRATARGLGLETDVRLPASRSNASGPGSHEQAAEPEAVARAPSPPPPLWHRGTLRSGQVVRHAGPVVLVGDVNPGAEVVSGGDVIVWGRLRGTALAGSPDNEDAVICALQMEPMLLGIGQVRTQMGGRLHHQSGRQEGANPFMARLSRGQLVVEPWNNGKR